MDVILLIVFFALFSLVTDRMDKKKRLPMPRRSPEKKLPDSMPAPMPQEEPLPFQIPEIRNAPKPAGEVYQETAARKPQAEEKQELLEKMQRRQAYERPQKEQAQHVRAAYAADSAEKRRILPVLTPDSAQQAVVLAEILGRPKAYRR